MKRVVITSVLMAFAVSGFSQQATQPTPPSPEQVAQREANSLSERLSLTEDQRSKAYSVYLDRAKKQQAEREARIKEMQRQRDQNIAESKQQDEKISQFLNQDQKKAYQQFQLQRQRPAGRADIRIRRPGLQDRSGFRQEMRRPRLQRPERPDFRFRQAPQRGFQREPQRFQQRPELRNNFRKGPDVPGPRPQINARPDRSFREDSRDRLQSRPDSLRRPMRNMPPPARDIRIKPAPDKI